MKRWLVAVSFAGLAAGATACGRGATPEPAAPSRSDAQTRAPRRHERPLPRLIAPPPAYGNRVVMARSSTKSTLN